MFLWPIFHGSAVAELKTGELKTGELKTGVKPVNTDEAGIPGWNLQHS